MILDFRTIAIGFALLLTVSVAHGKCYPGLDCPEDLPNANKTPVTPNQQVPESVPTPNEQQVIDKVVGWKTNDSPKDDAEMEDSNKVRKPVGNVGKFWDNLSWDDLSADEKKLWGALGWNSKLWVNGTAPASQNTEWNDLSEEERAAARFLGYNKKSWNQE
jgi:hypothetical protein